MKSNRTAKDKIYQGCILSSSNENRGGKVWMKRVWLLLSHSLHWLSQIFGAASAYMVVVCPSAVASLAQGVRWGAVEASCIYHRVPYINLARPERCSAGMQIHFQHGLQFCSCSLKSEQLWLSNWKAKSQLYIPASALISSFSAVCIIKFSILSTVLLVIGRRGIPICCTLLVGDFEVTFFARHVISAPLFREDKWSPLTI